MGFRVYETIPNSPDENQLVAAFDSRTGKLHGLIISSRVGTMRTGAIGGVAIDHLARKNASVMGVIGSGRQARAQILAATEVRDIEAVRIYSPTKRNREDLAAEMHNELSGSVEAVDTPKAAVTGAAIVSTATSSSEPVIDHAWLDPGCHLNMLGLKFIDRHEVAPDIRHFADVIVTDSLAQIQSYDSQFFFEQSEQMDEMVELSALVDAEMAGRMENNDISLFCSVGLAGTEIVLAQAALERNHNKEP